jgi:hypothetical protein
VGAGAQSAELGVPGATSAAYAALFAAAVQVVRQGQNDKAALVYFANVAAVVTYGIQHPKSRSKALRAYPCEPCGKETPFQNAQCLYCGAVLFVPLVNAAREKKDARKAMSYRERVTAGAINGHQKSIARRDHWKRMAEESRKKWESK